MANCRQFDPWARIKMNVRLLEGANQDVCLHRIIAAEFFGGRTIKRYLNRGDTVGGSVNVSSGAIGHGVFLGERLAQATLSAGAHVETGVEVLVTRDVADRTASGGCCVSSCSLL